MTIWLMILNALLGISIIFISKQVNKAEEKADELAEYLEHITQEIESLILHTNVITEILVRNADVVDELSENKCPHCNKLFKNEKGRNINMVRVHGRDLEN